MDKKKNYEFPSIEEIENYIRSDESDKNALEYEKAYYSLIDQVKDKTHSEKVAFFNGTYV